MIIRILTIVAVLSQLAGCVMSVPQTRPLADQATKQQAEAYTRYSEYANVYILRAFDNNFLSYYDAYIDDKQVSQLQSWQWVNLKAAPGRYRFRMSIAKSEYHLSEKLVAEFELGLQAGAQVFLSCGWNEDWDSSDRYMLPAEACAEGAERRPVTQNGVTYCGQSKPDWKSLSKRDLHGGEYSWAIFPTCRLIKDSNRYWKLTHTSNGNHAKMVIADVKEVTPATGIAMSANKVAVKVAVPATTKSKQLNSAAFIKLKTSESCKLVNEHWAYTGKGCKAGLANGTGSAEDNQGLKFVGSFAAGKRVEGEIFQNDEMIFSGKLVDDKPHGNAICLYESEYEECRYYKGKRIDTLYKIRKENAKMRAEMKRNQRVKPATYTSAKPKGVTDYAVDAAQQEATDRAVNYIFDSLF